MPKMFKPSHGVQKLWAQWLFSTFFFFPASTQVNMSSAPLTPEKQALPLLPKDRNFEGGDSPASTTSTYPAKRRKVDPLHEEEDALSSDDVPMSDVLPIASDLKPSKWQGTINNVVKAIVSIRFSQVAAFDTEGKTYHNNFKFSQLIHYLF